MGLSGCAYEPLHNQGTLLSVTMQAIVGD